MEGEELAFFGKVAAGVTHELKNVLAIINEANGLMADLLDMAKDAPMPYRDRFLRSIGKIEDQVRRGVEITGKFNRFSHSMDNPLADIELNGIMAQTVALAERFARLKNIRLEGSPSGKAVVLGKKNAFRLQMALTRGIEALMAAMTNPGVIRISVCNDAEQPAMDMSCEPDTSGEVILRDSVIASPEWQRFENSVALIGAEVLWRDDLVGTGFSVIFKGN